MTKTKFVFLITFFGIVFLVVYYLFTQNETQLAFPPKINPHDKTSSSVEVLQKMRLENRLSQANLPKAIEVKPVNESEAEAQMEYFDKKEEEWITSVKNLIDDDKLFQFYLVYREECEARKNEVYEDFHKNLEAKFGKNYKYSMSKDQLHREDEINEIYLKKMHKMLGDEKYQSYLKLKDDFNEKLAREANGKKALSFEF